MNNSVLQVFGPQAAQINGWLTNNNSTQKKYFQHQARLAEFDLLQKNLEENDPLSKNIYSKWFYEQEINKNLLKQNNKRLKKISTSPKNYKGAFQAIGIFQVLESLEQQYQAIETIAKVKKEK